MHSSLSLLSLAALASLASASQTFRVDVGNGALKFSPNNTVANIGDIVEFHFFPKNHTVTQGSFKTPCAVGSVPGGAFFSGFMPTTSGEAVSDSPHLKKNEPVTKMLTDSV
jgi:plastocyanin